MLHNDTCSDPSSELFRRDGSDEGSQHMVSIKNKKQISSKTPSYLELWLINVDLMMVRGLVLQNNAHSSYTEQSGLGLHCSYSEPHI